MRIIEAKEWEALVACPHCQSRLAVEANDVKHCSHKDYRGDTDYWYAADCAVCQGSIVLNREMIPAHIRRMAEARSGKK